MSISAGYTNPIDLLKYIISCQNWGDNPIGEPSSNARIRTGVGVSGSFDSTTLDTVRAINIRYQVTDVSESATDILIDKICKQFNLIQYTDGEGYRCVKYLFAETSDAAVRLFTIDDPREDIDDFSNPDPEKICVNPLIKYAYDYGLKTYTKQLSINNVQTGTFDETYTAGFDGTD